eukprot:5157901-Amphidinium_carterae.1
MKALARPSTHSSFAVRLTFTGGNDLEPLLKDLSSTGIGVSCRKGGNKPDQPNQDCARSLAPFGFTA